MKKCRLCNEVKPCSDFRIRHNYKDGRDNACKSCCTERSRKTKDKKKQERAKYFDYAFPF